MLLTEIPHGCGREEQQNKWMRRLGILKEKKFTRLPRSKATPD
jgi:hypothetical protein